MKFRWGTVEISISIIFIAFPVLAWAAGRLKEYSVAFFSVMLHELGHIAIARYYGARTVSVRITPAGFAAAIDDRGVHGRELIKIYLAGPLSNMLLGAAAMLANKALNGMWGIMDLVSSTNLLLALFNLLPVYPLDGGRILTEALSRRFGFKTAGLLTRRAALIISYMLLIAGAFRFYAGEGNISLIIVGLYMQAALKTSETESALMNIRQILNRRLRLAKKGVYPARGIVVTKGMKVYELLKSMDFDRFHIIYVLDENFRLSKIYTEAEIIDTLAGDGKNLTFEGLIGKTCGFQTNDDEERYNQGNIDI